MMRLMKRKEKVIAETNGYVTAVIVTVSGRNFWLEFGMKNLERNEEESSSLLSRIPSRVVGFTVQ